MVINQIMDKHAAISQQAELLLKKKHEIELKKKADLQKQIIELQNNKSVKRESNEPSEVVTKILKSRASFSRHKALLRSGLIEKNKSENQNTSRITEGSLSNAFDYSHYSETKSSRDVKSVHGRSASSSLDNKSTTSDTKSDITSGDSEASTAWFQEAIQRAKQKAQEANASAGIASTVSCSSNTSASNKRSRWGEMPSSSPAAPVGTHSTSHGGGHGSSIGRGGGGGVLSLSVPTSIMGMVKDGEHLDAIKGVMLTRLTRESPVIVTYAKQVFGSTQYLTEDQWKQCEEQIKMNVVFQLLQAKQIAADRLSEQGKVMYEYDSDEDIDGGTWEHKRRKQEMEKTARKACDLTVKGSGKHHIGDFLPPEEMKKFMEKFSAIREGRDPDFSDYKNNKLTEDNIGYKMLKSMGWTEGQGLGPRGAGITQPVNQNGRVANTGLGMDTPDKLTEEDTEYDAYRKRMMLSYRFRPNPLNNPRRPYY